MRASNWSLALCLAAAVPTLGLWQGNDEEWMSKHGAPGKSWFNNEVWRGNSRGLNEWNGWSSSSPGKTSATAISVVTKHVVPVPMSLSSHKPSADPHSSSLLSSHKPSAHRHSSLPLSGHKPSAGPHSSFSSMPYWKNTTQFRAASVYHGDLMTTSTLYSTEVITVKVCPSNFMHCSWSAKTSSVLTKTYTKTTVIQLSLTSGASTSTSQASPVIDSTAALPVSTSSVYLVQTVTVSTLGTTSRDLTVLGSPIHTTLSPSLDALSSSAVAGLSSTVPTPAAPADASRSARLSSDPAIPVHSAKAESRTSNGESIPAGSQLASTEAPLSTDTVNASPALSSMAGSKFSSTAAVVSSGNHATTEKAIVFSYVTQISTVSITTYKSTATQTAGGITSESVSSRISTITVVGPTTIYITSTLTKICTEQACAPATSGAPTTTVTLTAVYTSTSSSNSNGDETSITTTSKPILITKTITLTASYVYNALASSQSVGTGALTSSSVISFVKVNFSAESSTPASLTTDTSYVSIVSSGRWSAHLFSSHVRGKSASLTANRASPHSSHFYGNMTSSSVGSTFASSTFAGASASQTVSSSIPGWANLTSLTMNATISSPIKTTQAPLLYFSSNKLYINTTLVISSSSSIPSSVNTYSPVIITRTTTVHSTATRSYANAISPIFFSNTTLLAKNITEISPVTNTWVPIMPSSRSSLYTNATLSIPSSSLTISSFTLTISSSSSTSSCAPTAQPTFLPACQSYDIPNCIPCEGQPGSDPATWCGLTTATDYYKEWPKTCKKITCKLEITNTTVAPDGISRLGMIYNNQFPGPTIEANWGDEVEVHLTNQLTANGTSIHFHGVRQLWTNEMDGVPSITQCPLSGDGDQMTYRWIATQYGSSWYHSHYSLQAWEGAVGPMFIHGPSTAEYDIDLGPVMIQDWLHTPVFELFESVEKTGSPVQDNGLINGKNIYVDPTTNAITGSRSKFVFQKGKKHYMRLVNMALDSSFAFSIDKHTIQVVATDFVPIIPYTTDVLKIAVGQRYDIIVEANQDVDDYWLRIDPLTYSVAPGRVPPCGSYNTMDGDIKAIISYNGSCGTPTTTTWAHDNVCMDEPYASLTPYLPKNVGAVDKEVTESIVIVGNTNTSIYRWYLSGTTFQVEFNQPTLLDIYQNNTAYAGPLAIELPMAEQWVYIIIESPIPLPHPIHLHGHDFHVLGSGLGTYANQPLNMNNPPRRDVASLPSSGYLVLAFLTDNPGAWLMHCHIGWHVSMGFALQWIEQAPAAARNITDPGALVDTCVKYNIFMTTAHVVQDDSGV